MELNWSTFLLEIINFIILVWILKRFLYKPVLNIISRRQAGIEQTLAEARHLHTDAESLRNQYENRLRDWEQERQLARDKLQTEIDEQRAVLMKKLQESLEKAREKTEVSERRRLKNLIKKAEEESLNHGAEFAARILKHASGPELEASLQELFINELNSLPAERREPVVASLEEGPNDIHVISAYPLNESQRQLLEKAFNTLTQQALSFSYTEDSDLLAGLRINIGAWQLGINVQDELKGFAELIHGK
ncbi:F0F1 ATP synthase subunit delta [Kaarinaea lacus]